MAEVLRGIKGFEWDEGNSAKNEAKHGVTDRESEEIFFNKPLLVTRSSKGGKGDSVRCAGEDLRQSAFDRSVYRSCEEDSRDQRAPDGQKREERV
jgi:hypothetical protein